MPFPPKMSDNHALLTFQRLIRHYRHLIIDFLPPKWHNQWRVMKMLRTTDGRSWVTIREAARKLKVSPSRVARLIREGKVDSLRLSPRVILIDWQQATFWRERYYSKRKAEAVKKRQKRQKRQRNNE